MLNLFNRIFKSKAFKTLLRIIASLASAIVVLSGLLFFMSLNSKEKEEESIAGKEEPENEPDQISSEEA